MVLWRRGEADKARQSYDAAAREIAKHPSDDPDLRALRAEAERLLGQTSAAPPAP
jgi:hypothetical protein